MHAYQKAISGALPPEVETIVRSRFSDIESPHDPVRALELTHAR